MAFALPSINAKTDVSSDSAQSGDLLETKSGATAKAASFSVNKSMLPAWAPWAGLGLGLILLLKFGK